MKKIILLCLLVMGVALTGCDTYEYKDTVPTVQVLESDLSVAITQPGGEGTILTSTNGAAISATSDKDWCVVSVSGLTVNVTTDPNEGTSNRTAVVTITSKGWSTTVSVTQKPFILYPLSYEELLGEWTLSGVNPLAGTGEVIDYPVTITEKVAGSVITMEGYPMSGFICDLNFDSVTAELSLYMGQLAAQMDGNYYLLAGIDAQQEMFDIEETTYFSGVWNGDSDAPQFAFTGGVFADLNITAFSILGLDGEFNLVGLYDVLGDVTLTKNVELSRRFLL